MILGSVGQNSVTKQIDNSTELNVCVTLWLNTEQSSYKLTDRHRKTNWTPQTFSLFEERVKSELRFVTLFISTFWIFEHLCLERNNACYKSTFNECLGLLMCVYVAYISTLIVIA